MNKLTGFACAMLLSSASLAQAQVGSTTTTTTTTTSPGPTLRASQILGSTVHLDGTNDFGKVEDIVLSEDGGPTYLVVSSSTGSALMPLGAASFNPGQTAGQRSISYNVTSQAIQPLLFNQTAYPNIADEKFVSRTNQVFPGGNQKTKVKVKPNGTIKEKIKN